MWTKALDTHTKFSKGPLVRVGGSLKALCGWKAGGGGAGRGRDGGCVENRVPRDGGEGAGEGGRGCSGRGLAGGAAVQGSVGDSGAGLDGGGTSRARLQPGSASRVKGEGKGRRRPFPFFFFLTERSRAGWGRRSPFSFSFPLSLSLFKVHFRPTGFVGSERGSSRSVTVASFPLRLLTNV